MGAPEAERQEIPGVPTSVVLFSGGAVFVCYSGQASLGILQPSIQTELDLSLSEASWIFNAFMLSFALSVGVAGRLADHFGHKRAISAGLALSSVGFVIAALAPSFSVLATGLAISGVGASPLYPSAVAFVANRVPDSTRGRVMGLVALIGSTGFSVQPIVAGILAVTASWRYAFGVAAAVALLVLFVAGRFVHQDRVQKDPFRLSPIGILLLLPSIAAIVVAIAESLAWGWGSALTLGLLFGGIGGLGIFAAHQLRSEKPLLNLRLFAIRSFLGGTLALVAFQFGLVGFTLFMAIYLQHVLHFHAFLAAVAMLLATVLFPISAGLVGRVVDRLGIRVPALFGVVLLIFSFVWLGIFADHDSYALLAPAFVAFGIGAAAGPVPLVLAVTFSVVPEERAQANALVMTLRFFSAALAAAILSATVSAERVAGLTADFRAAHFPLSDVRVASEAPAHGLKHMEAVAHDIGPGVVDMIQRATTAGYETGFFIMAGVVGAGLFAVLFLVEANPTPQRE